ncbi:hypothetical protein C1752_03762 [Acaryochloris thomasi RCC1774]|uniref:Uncharacterized protein n=1 Tax=Acaryochloris thomasi RCC1774 TaxID=1764569 RepID=A0A2W1JFE2_9CYAN|nr:hypothetical protein [Acaryochloris thomasi]PZD72176.1 hypothetical protein C1752_03762 [Acaryochloris thomasi RCC1774]
MRHTQELTIAPNEILENTLAVTLPLLNQTGVQELISSYGELGSDPSSDYFTTRTKHIAVLCINGEWFQIRAHCFELKF